MNVIKRQFRDFMSARDAGRVVGLAMEQYDKGEYGEVITTLRTYLQGPEYSEKHINDVFVGCLLGRAYNNIGMSEPAERLITEAYERHIRQDSKKAYRLCTKSYRYFLGYLALSLEMVGHSNDAATIRNQAGLPNQAL